MSGILKTEEIADHIFEMAGLGLFRYYCFMKNISKIMLPTGINIKYKSPRRFSSVQIKIENCVINRNIYDYLTS